MKVYMVPAGDDGVNVRIEDGGRAYSFLGYITSSELDVSYDDYGDFREPMLRVPRRTYKLELDLKELQMTDMPAAQAFAQLFASFPQRYVMAMDDSVGETGPFIEEAPAEVEDTPDIPTTWIDFSGES